MTSRLNARISVLEDQRTSQMQCHEMTPEEVARRVIFQLQRIKHGYTKDDKLLELLRRDPTLGAHLDQFMSEA